jgi:hypothetical protein
MNPNGIKKPMPFLRLGETVPCTPDGLDIRVVAAWLERLSESTDVNVDGAVLYENMITPYLI